MFDTGHNRKTDARDAHSIAVVAVVAVRTKAPHILAAGGELEALRKLRDRRDELDAGDDRLARILADVGDITRFATEAGSRPDRHRTARRLLR